MFKGLNVENNLPPCSDRYNATSPYSVQNGVTPDYASERSAKEATDYISEHHNMTASSTENVEGAVWFLMRAAYGQEQKAKAYLEARGIKVFLPLQEKTYLYKGKKRHRLVSLIPNFLFVKSKEEELKKYIGKKPLDFFHHYYVPHKDSDGKAVGKKGLKPLVIPTRQMAYFIKWNSVEDDCKLFVADDRIPITKNERVKITDGKFAGLEGYVYRIKGQSRVGIIVEGVGTVFTAYVPKNYLEKCNTK